MNREANARGEYLSSSLSAETNSFRGPLIFAPGRSKELIALLGPLRKIVESLEAAGKLVIYLAFSKAPGTSEIQPIAMIFYDGPVAEARKLAAPLYELSPIMDMMSSFQYDRITYPNPRGLGPLEKQNYQTGNCPIWSEEDACILEHMVMDLSVFAMKYGAGVAPSKVLIEVRSDAKSSSVPISATAFAARRPAMTAYMEAQYDDSLSHVDMRREVKAIIDGAKASARKSSRHPEGGAIFNANIGTGDEKVDDMFGENLPRLRALKKKYDPNFIFNKWHPITPAED